MLIKLPYVDTIDAANPPDDLEQLVQESFKRFTDGTSEEYRNVDKLLYLDNLRKKYIDPKPGTTSDRVRELMHNLFDYHVDYAGEFPDASDFKSVEFMENCYEAGDNPFYKHREGLSSREGKKAHDTIFEIIRIVCEA